MRILFCTGSSASYMAPPPLSDEQVNCGPDWMDRDIGGHMLSLGTPRGEFDLYAVASRLPADQQPDVVVCLVDASWRAMPRNLRAFRCPKVLLVADTHHMSSPITGMVRYALSEPFDRVVLLYDRHHWEFFRAAGVRQLHWLPGLTFPHSDRAVLQARSAAARAPHVGFVGQVGINHPRRIQMLTRLQSNHVALQVKSLSQREALGFYGSSLVGFNASLNGDLNLRVMEIMATGAMLLTDELAPASGLLDLWKPGTELVTYRTPDEMVERARYALDHPVEAQAIGRAAARWFDSNFNENARRAAFKNLVFDGLERPEFTVPQQSACGIRKSTDSVHQRLVAAFEYVQELHRNLDRVCIALDETVPEDFVHMCRALPRLDVTQGAPPAGRRVHFLGVGRKNFGSTALFNAATHLWPWDYVESDRVTLIRKCASMGFGVTDAAVLVFSRHQVNTQTNVGAGARWALERGDYENAYSGAKTELAKNPKSVDALIVLAELAQESHDAASLQSALAQLQTLAPHHPRVREIVTSSEQAIHHRRAKRITAVARALFEQQRLPEAIKMARDALGKDPYSAEAHHLIARSMSIQGDVEQALNCHAVATRSAPESAEYWYEFGRTLRKHRRAGDALAPLVLSCFLDPENFEFQLALGETALAAGHAPIACDALKTACEIKPESVAAKAWWQRAQLLSEQAGRPASKDLLFSHLEITPLQGTGVLLRRFFPDSSDFVSIRSHTFYKGEVRFGGIHFSMDLPGASIGMRRAVLARLLKPYQIRRILTVPYFAEDFSDAIAAKELTNAPLCTYVMDDQTVYSQAVPQELAQRLFAISDLRLAISPEMVTAYSTLFGCTFGLLPPIITSNADVVSNTWADKGRIDRCVLVGNIWSAKQFEQLRTFTRTAGLKVDWFGNSNVSWLPQDKDALEKDGIFRGGFLPEDELALRLSQYPFVIVPSGTLDGTEENEWLTRLSLPSRMVFIVTKTQTPMLVLGNSETAAARFVNHLQLGVTSNYDTAEAREKIAQITHGEQREHFLRSARRIAPSFLMPDCGEWIWESLAAKRPSPTPFDHLYPDMCDRSGDSGSSIAGVSNFQNSANTDITPFKRWLGEIGRQLSDHDLVSSYFAADEPRQKEDVRGGLRLLQKAFQQFEGLNTRLFAAHQLAQLLPNSRPVLVLWAELLEEKGDRKGAAAKARKALSLFYDDVYTQTLFVRCVGDTNYHANAQDRFCPHPFENFEIYEDGSVYPCNCTQVPFPIGNAFTQDAETIWRSPVAKAIRESILDGSFRFCSPMTCWKRFDLPKRSEQPQQFEKLQHIGVEGSVPPKFLNLSYDRSCNLSCPSCRKTTLMATQPQRQQFEQVRDNIVLPLLARKTAESIYITGSGDAFGSPHFRGVLKELCDPKYSHIEITLGTNGQLITERLWNEFQPLHARFRDITVSIDGATPETYERLRRGSTWEKLLRTMGILAGARRAGAIRRIMVNMVVQEANFLEMPRLIELCKEWSVNGIRFYRIRQWGHVAPTEFRDSDIANPLHPRHVELLALLADPIFADPIVDHYDMYALILEAQRASVLNSAKVTNALSAGAEVVGAELQAV